MPKLLRMRGLPVRVSAIPSNAETQLVEMEERLEFARRFNEIRAGVEKIRHAAHDIKV